jgi:uncharacterized BrkB/YihY/UPF0761 family membrane protein
MYASAASGSCRSLSLFHRAKLRILDPRGSVARRLSSILLPLALLFALMFKHLPDAEVSWQDIGSAVTALLFEVGKFLIGLYIGKQGLESSFGAASSLVVVLIWVYYSAQIVLMGAEFTRANALENQPSDTAVRNQKKPSTP